MKRMGILWVVMVAFCLQGQAQHLFEHAYPQIQAEDERIRLLMEQVSKDSLEATIEHMQGYHTRRWDSQMVYDVQDWLYSVYAGMVIDSVFLHDFQFVLHDTLRETSDNVIAIQRGVLYPDEYVVCGAHYDSYNNSPGHPDSLRAPGADDNASGTAGIIETARLLSRCTFERSIMYCGWAAEEAYLRGSAAYAHDCAERLVDIVGYFNLDMTGYLEEGQEMRVDLVYVERDTVIGNYVFNFCDVYYPDMQVRRGWYPTGADSDFSSFNRNGYLAIHPFEKSHHTSPFIHSTSDVLGVSVNNMDQAKRFTELNLGLVATLAGLVSDGVDEAVADPLTVFPNPAHDQITVKGSALRQISINNPVGQQVFSRVLNGEEECTVPLGMLAPGIYFVKATSRVGTVVTQKLVVY